MTMPLSAPAVAPVVAARTRVRIGYLLVLAAILAAAVVPFLAPPYVVQNYTRVLIVALPTVGLNLLTGYGGVISLGQSVFFGLGAYVTAILVADHGWAWWQTLPLAVALPLAAGVLIGIPSLRIRGVYFAIVTLVLAAWFPNVIQRFNETTGGNQGKSLTVMQAPGWLGLAQDQYGYLVSLCFLLLVLLLLRNLARGRTGRALTAMRDNEVAAATQGVDVARTKIYVSGLSAAAAGLGGCLYAATQGIVSSETAYFTVVGAIEFLAAMVIGGAGTVLGPIVGALVTERLPVLLSDVDPQLAVAAYGVLLIVVVRVMPAGLVGFATTLARRLTARVTQHHTTVNARNEGKP
ncbi:MAG: branched-chain amino acid ABC transporter permease [Nocardioidaceae bacterium]|nr:branched-chain amino acid ABC transporter permease [Nocardioidaceae bacterium]